MSIQCQYNELASCNPQPATWFCLDLDTIDYNEALELQHRLVAARKSAILGTDTLLILEHPPVFTLGRRGGRENLRVSDEFLNKSGVRVIQAERGGNITFHGPGQLVVYLIYDLEAARMGVNDYVEQLEEIMIRIANDRKIRAERNDTNRGIWVGSNKIGSIGIAIRKGISFHGLALNVNLSLDPFSWINPCGLQNIGMTSLQKESEQSVSMPEIRKAFKRHFGVVFGAKLKTVTFVEMQKLLQTDL